MGKPAYIGDMNDGITPPPPYSRDTDETNAENSVVKPSRKRLYRNLNNKVIGGVFGGLSTYLGWDANIMRLLYAALCIATYVWPLVLLYLIAWMIIPPANNPRRILESQGNPVTIDNIGQEVLSSTPPLGHEADNSSVTFVENAFRGIRQISDGTHRTHRGCRDTCGNRFLRVFPRRVHSKLRIR